MLSVIANKTKRLKQQTFFILVKVFILVKQIRLLILKIKVYVHRVNATINTILHEEVKKERLLYASVIVKIPVGGIFGYIASYLFYCFFMIDSLGVIPKYSLYL